MLSGLPYREVWCVDFEFSAPPGEPPSPLCMVAWEMRSGRRVRLWGDELGSESPFAMGEEALFVAYYASAEFGCHLSLGWTLPMNVLDVFVEFRNLTNGLPTTCGSGLLGALAHFGLEAIDSAEKDSMRELAL